MTPLFRLPQWSTGHVLTETVRKPQGFHMRTALPLQPFQMVAGFGFQSHLSYSMGHGDSGSSRLAQEADSHYNSLLGWLTKLWIQLGLILNEAEMQGSVRLMDIVKLKFIILCVFH